MTAPQHLLPRAAAGVRRVLADFPFFFTNDHVQVIWRLPNRAYSTNSVTGDSR